MKYATVQQKITDKIYQENLRDDKGEYFGFGSHMYRHIYGMKLARCMWMTGQSQDYWGIEA